MYVVLRYITTIELILLYTYVQLWNVILLLKHYSNNRSRSVILQIGMMSLFSSTCQFSMHSVLLHMGTILFSFNLYTRCFQSQASTASQHTHEVFSASL